MKVVIHAIGLLKNGPELDLLSEYQKRLRWPLLIREFQSKKTGSALEIKLDEASLLLQGIPNTAYVIALDERGTVLSSPDFARQLQDCQTHGISEIYLIIGGSDGLDESVRRRANKIISFGKMTWPHKLVRAMLVEQLYRCQQILMGHPYHK